MDQECQISSIMQTTPYLTTYRNPVFQQEDPNVFGMGTFADGGLFATKPYSCGSNYLLKMSNYKKGEWCDVVDGLYWKFMNDNLDFFKSNPRLALIPRALDRMKNERKGIIFSKFVIFDQFYFDCLYFYLTCYQYL